MFAGRSHADQRLLTGRLDSVEQARGRERLFVNQRIHLVFESEVSELQPGLSAFPQEVFTPEQPWLAEHFLPLLSIDLGLLRSELSGRVVRMLCPIEPFDGYIGDATEAFHNAYASTNWLAFELTPENQYRFLGQEGYFQFAPQHGGALTQDAHADEHRATMRDSHAKAKAYFDEHQRLASYSMYGDGTPQESAYLDQLGGVISSGNWAGHPPPPTAFVLEDLAGMQQKGSVRYRGDSSQLPDDGLRITHNGHPFFHVGDRGGVQLVRHRGRRHSDVLRAPKPHCAVHVRLDLTLAKRQATTGFEMQRCI